MPKPLHVELDPLTARIKQWDMTSDGHVIQRTMQDTKPLLDANALLRNDSDATRQQIKKGMLKVGSIPLELVEKWRVEEGFDIWKAPTSEVLKRLRMAEYEKLRTTDAKF